MRMLTWHMLTQHMRVLVWHMHVLTWLALPPQQPSTLTCLVSLYLDSRCTAQHSIACHDAGVYRK
jgi:hypothetical protein